MILYNGATGSLGQYMAPALDGSGLKYRRLTSRLGDDAMLAHELADIDPNDDITLIQLAAMVSVPACEADPAGAFATNVDGARSVVANVVEWAHQHGASVQVIYVSTGHVYAPPSGQRLISELADLDPRSTYARTKLSAEEVLRNLARERQFPLVAARLFGLLAPRQPQHYVMPGLIKRVQERRIHNVPGLDHVRDYLDARDACQGLVELAEVLGPNTPPVVNICSGVPVRIRDLMSSIAEILDRSLIGELDVCTSGAGRPTDVPWLVGDPELFVGMVGHSPRRRPLVRTIRDAVEASQAQATC